MVTHPFGRRSGKTKHVGSKSLFGATEVLSGLGGYEISNQPQRRLTPRWRNLLAGWHPTFAAYVLNLVHTA